MKRSGLSRGKPIGRGKKRLPRRTQPTTGFRLWVRATGRCLIRTCRRPEPDPHHVKARGMGRSVDPWAEDERNAVELCREHHQLGESPGWSWKRFEDEFGVDLREEARKLWARWMALPAEVRGKWENRATRLNMKRGAKPVKRRAT